MIDGIRAVHATEWRAILDRQARRLLGIDADQFVANYLAGEYDDLFDDDPDVTWLVMLVEPYIHR